MVGWIVLCIGAFLAIIIASEIYFHRMTLAQIRRGASAILALPVVAACWIITAWLVKYSAGCLRISTTYAWLFAFAAAGILVAVRAYR